MSTNTPNTKAGNNKSGNAIINNPKINNASKSAEPSTIINAPSMKNTSKQSLITASNMKPNNSQIAANNLQTAKEDSGIYEVVSDNYLILLAITSAIIIIVIIYFFSQTFRVGRTISQMETYQSYQELESIDYSKYGNRRIGDYHISSAYNASHVGYQMFDYTHENIVRTCLQSGVRYLEFNVFNSEYGSSAFPVASMGYKQGEWKMMVNDTPMETIFEIIANNAFKVFDGAEGCFNPDDPVFIGFNLNTNSNLPCLNLLAFLITKYFSENLLPNAYSFQNNDAIADIPLSQLMKKVVIFSSDGFQGSGMEEVVNYSWDNTDSNPKHAMRRLHYSDLTAPKFNKQELIDFNRTGLTVIVPHKEGDFWNTNYNPVVAKDLGCQFIAMEFQYIDSNMDYYITLFKNKSMVMKDDDLLKGRRNRSRTTTTAPSATASRTTTTSGNSSNTTTRPNATTRPATTRPSATNASSRIATTRPAT
jgi:hypothetical protein